MKGTGKGLEFPGKPQNWENFPQNSFFPREKKTPKLGKPPKTRRKIPKTREKTQTNKQKLGGKTPKLGEKPQKFRKIASISGGKSQTLEKKIQVLPHLCSPESQTWEFLGSRVFSFLIFFFFFIPEFPGGFSSLGKQIPAAEEFPRNSHCSSGWTLDPDIPGAGSGKSGKIPSKIGEKRDRWEFFWGKKNEEMKLLRVVLPIFWGMFGSKSGWELLIPKFGD